MCFFLLIGSFPTQFFPSSFTLPHSVLSGEIMSSVITNEVHIPYHHSNPHIYFHLGSKVLYIQWSHPPHLFATVPGDNSGLIYQTALQLFLLCRQRLLLPRRSTAHPFSSRSKWVQKGSGFSNNVKTNVKLLLLEKVYICFHFLKLLSLGSSCTFLCFFPLIPPSRLPPDLWCL